MLTAQELEFIRCNAYLWDHCWRFFSLAAGEPFLVDGCLAHFDGTHLYFNSHPIDRAIRISPERALRSLIERFNPRLVWHTGIEPVREMRLGGDLRLIQESTPSEDDVCMEISLPDFVLGDDPRRASWVRSCERRNFRWTMSESAVLGYRHLLMVEEVVRRISPGPVARSLISRVGDFTRQPFALLIEAFCGDELAAFCIVEGWFEQMDISLFSFGNHHISGAKDYLQWAVIQSAQQRGKPILNVGYSISSGVRAFKEKWGAKAVTRGYFDQLWHSYPTFDLRLCHWSHRLVLMDTAPDLTTTT